MKNDYGLPDVTSLKQKNVGRSRIIFVPDYRDTAAVTEGIKKGISEFNLIFGYAPSEVWVYPGVPMGVPEKMDGIPVIRSNNVISNSIFVKG